MSDAVAREAGLHRELTPGQVTMIALGGAIGTGLFLGTTLAVGVAGPGVVISYLIGAVVVYLMTLALGQLAVRHPTAGSFGVHAEIYQGKWAGYAVRWTYWFCQTIAIGGEVVASGVYVRAWFPALPLWIPVVVFALLLVAINAMHVGAFGRLEYWFAMLKVVAIVLFILFGIAILTGLRPATVPGLAGYRPLAPMGWTSIWLAVPLVMFSYLGTEIVAVTAGETKDPERAIPRALRTTVVRLILFYVLAMALLMALMPWREISPQRSPFVRVFEIIGIRGAASLMNFVVLTAALSAINTDLYLTSRMLFSLARSGDAPALFGRLGKRGTPIPALLASAAGMAFAAILSKTIPDNAFVFLFGVAIFGGLFVWAMIFLTHLRFLKRERANALERADAQSARGALARWRYMASLAGFMAMVAIIVTTWWVPGLKVTLLSGIPWLLLLALAYSVTRLRPASLAR